MPNGLNLEISPERVEFKELEIGDYLFHSNCFWIKLSTQVAEVVSEPYRYEIGSTKQFTQNCTINIVINKNTL